MEDFKTHLHQHALEEEEEEDEAQMGNYRNPVSELNSFTGSVGENENEDMSSSSRTIPSGSIQGAMVAQMKDSQRGYACSVCGKVYIYLVSFRKHQQLHENQTKSSNVQDLKKYECPECGLSFIRRARLLGHLRIHRSHKSSESKPPRCDQCNRYFKSLKSWMTHIDLHKQKPFWCLSCAQGFIDELALDKHLQSHSVKPLTCSICHKRFHTAAKLKNHYNTRKCAKTHKCTICGKSFFFPGTLLSHRKKHFKGHFGSGGMPLGIKNSSAIVKKRIVTKRRVILTSVKEEPEMGTNMEELPLKEELVRRSKTLLQCKDAEFRDIADSEESDCGEPVHCLKPSKPPGLSGYDPSDKPRSKTLELQTVQELKESRLQEKHMHREHKYWEWECCECDMGFDEVAKLHMHYIKHATGELPIPQDYSED